MLFCGNRQADWQSIADLTALLMQANAIELSSSAAVLQRTATLGARNALELCATRRQGPTLKGLSVPEFVGLLDNGRFRRVTEQVDRVWEILGLTPLDVQKAAQSFIDYSPEGRRDYYRAYKSLVRLLLPKDPDLFILSTDPSLRVPVGLPSWCPNFRAVRANGGQIQFTNHPFKTNGSTIGDAPAVFEPNSDVLRLRGFRIDKVDKIVKIENSEPSSWEEEVMAFIRLDKTIVW